MYSQKEGLLAYRAGNGIARRYENAMKTKFAAIAGTGGQGCLSVFNGISAARGVAPGITGVAAVGSGYFTKLCFDCYKNAASAVKKLQPEYDKIVKRAKQIKKASVK